MTAPTPAEVEAIAEVMCHEYHPMHWDVAYGNRTKPCQACKIHAAALLASPALATLCAHERANALRDAADELHRLWVKDGRHYGHPGCYSSGYEVWLRDRADRQEPQ